MRKYKAKKTKKSSVVATITTIIISIFAFCYIAKSVIEAENIEENFPCDCTCPCGRHYDEE